MELVNMLLMIIFGTVFLAPLVRWIIIVPCYQFCALRTAAQERAAKEERTENEAEKVRLKEMQDKEVQRLRKKEKKFRKVHAEIEEKQWQEQHNHDAMNMPKKKKKKKKEQGSSAAADAYAAALKNAANRTVDKVHFNDGILNGEQSNAKAKAEKIQKEIAERAARNRKGDFHS